MAEVQERISPTAAVLPSLVWKGDKIPDAFLMNSRGAGSAYTQSLGLYGNSRPKLELFVDLSFCTRIRFKVRLQIRLRCREIPLELEDLRRRICETTFSGDGRLLAIWPKLIPVEATIILDSSLLYLPPSSHSPTHTGRSSTSSTAQSSQSQHSTNSHSDLAVAENSIGGISHLSGDHVNEPFIGEDEVSGVLLHHKQVIKP
ncbi:unnamed protein product [Ilex paraguariensis]|uniref:C2 NT-type domain-containing protein n=1 Tax=Ilex paraguariensis TaxID=185542 RepID=A0ABC8UDJ1_9AQUA